MKLLKHFYKSNRHMKLAVILAPLLAIGGYILTGILLEKKIDAQPGTAKAMTLQPGCHLLTDKCELLHREIAANIAIEETQGTQVFYLATSVAIRGALLSTNDSEPQPMINRGTAKRWKLELDQSIVQGTPIRLALVGKKHQYFAEIPADR